MRPVLRGKPKQHMSQSLQGPSFMCTHLAMDGPLNPVGMSHFGVVPSLAACSIGLLALSFSLSNPMLISGRVLWGNFAFWHNPVSCFHVKSAGSSCRPLVHAWAEGRIQSFVRFWAVSYASKSATGRAKYLDFPGVRLQRPSKSASAIGKKQRNEDPRQLP